MMLVDPESWKVVEGRRKEVNVVGGGGRWWEMVVCGEVWREVDGRRKVSEGVG